MFFWPKEIIRNAQSDYFWFVTTQFFNFASLRYKFRWLNRLSYFILKFWIVTFKDDCAVWIPDYFLFADRHFFQNFPHFWYRFMQFNNLCCFYLKFILLLYKRSTNIQTIRNGKPNMMAGTTAKCNTLRGLSVFSVP